MFSHDHFCKRRAVPDSYNCRASLEVRYGQVHHFQTFLRNINFLENTTQKKIQGKSDASWVCLPEPEFVFNGIPALMHRPLSPLLFIHLQKKNTGLLLKFQKDYMVMLFITHAFLTFFLGCSKYVDKRNRIRHQTT